jgi:hypothetical protein
LLRKFADSGKNHSVGNVPFCSTSHTAFSTFSGQVLESANLRNNHNMRQHLVFASSIWYSLTDKQAVVSHAHVSVVQAHQAGLQSADLLASLMTL